MNEETCACIEELMLSSMKPNLYEHYILIKHGGLMGGDLGDAKQTEKAV